MMKKPDSSLFGSIFAHYYAKGLGWTLLFFGISRIG